MMRLNRVFFLALVMLFFTSTMTLNAYAFGEKELFFNPKASCEAKKQGWGSCVGNIQVTPSGIIITTIARKETLYKGLVNAPPEMYGCKKPSNPEVAFHSDINGWGESGAWSVFFRYRTIIPNNYPAKGYFEMRVLCENGDFHYMPFNSAYWSISNTTGQSITIDEDYLFLLGEYREPHTEVIDDDTVEMDFGTNIVHSLADEYGMIAPLASENVISCGFLFWNPDQTYQGFPLEQQQDFSLISAIKDFPFDTYGFFVCELRGGGFGFIAKDIWNFPVGTLFSGDASYAIRKP